MPSDSLGRPWERAAAPHPHVPPHPGEQALRKGPEKQACLTYEVTFGATEPLWAPLASVTLKGQGTGTESTTQEGRRARPRCDWPGQFQKWSKEAGLTLLRVAEARDEITSRYVQKEKGHDPSTKDRLL